VLPSWYFYLMCPPIQTLTMIVKRTMIDIFVEAIRCRERGNGGCTIYSQLLGYKAPVLGTLHTCLWEGCS